MDTEDTYLAGAIESAGPEARYDAEAKKILASKTILAWILRDCVSEFEGMTIDEILPCIEGVVVGQEGVLPAIDGNSNDDAPSGEGKITYDVKFKAFPPPKKDQSTKEGKKEPITLIINVEGQQKLRPGYSIPKRAEFYMTRLISSQQGKEFKIPKYNQIKKVYSIWILMDARKPFISRLRFILEDLYGKFPSDIEYDLERAIFIGIPKHSIEGTELQKMLGTVFSTDLRPTEKIKSLEDDFDFRLSKLDKEALNTMCNFSQGVLEKGIAEGRAEGLVDGAAQELRRTVTSLKEKFSLEEIANLLGRPLSEIESATK